MRQKPFKWKIGAILAVLLAFLSQNAYSLDIDKLVDAVYKAEGGKKASVPYGLIYDKWCIKEGACRYYAMEILGIHANRCDNSSDIIHCIGSYYSPPKAHKLNSHWVKNVKYWYNKLGGKS